MSHQATTWAMRNSKARLGDRLVLLVLADHAKDDGTCAWPSVETIAKCSLLSERQVKRCLANLVEIGEISAVGKSRAGTIIYDIPPFIAWEAAVAKVEQRGDILSTGGDKSGTESVVDVTRSVMNGPEVVTPLTPHGGNEDLKRVYDHWRSARGKRRANYNTISPARARKIRQRLHEFSEAELCQAIDGVARDPWPDRRMHDDITVIFRSREQVDRFIELGSVSPSGKPIATPFDRAMRWASNVGWQYADEDVEAELAKFDLIEGERIIVRQSVEDARARHAVDAA